MSVSPRIYSDACFRNGCHAVLFEVRNADLNPFARGLREFRMSRRRSKVRMKFIVAADPSTEVALVCQNSILWHLLHWNLWLEQQGLLSFFVVAIQCELF